MTSKRCTVDDGGRGTQGLLLVLTLLNRLGGLDLFHAQPGDAGALDCTLLEHQFFKAEIIALTRLFDR